MKTSLHVKTGLWIFLLNFCMVSLSAQVLLETNFTEEEGWVKEGNASSSDTQIYERTVTYNGNNFTFKFYQAAVNPTESEVADTPCSTGSININKNNKKVFGTVVNDGPHLELPVFDKDVRVTIASASSKDADRCIVIEHSIDDGVTWMADEDNISPTKTPDKLCNPFISPFRFVAGTRIRLANHSGGGGLKVYTLKVEEFNADNVPPTLEEITPANGATEISPSLRKIEMVFDEPVKAGGDGNIIISDGGASTLMLTSDNLTYNQENVTINFPSDFHLLVNATYVVYIQSGAIKDMSNNPAADIQSSFTTKVTASSAKDILSFKVPGQIGDETINAQAATISLTLNYDVDLEQINPVIEVSEYAVVDEDYKDFSSGSAVYTVTAEDGTKKDWTVTVTKIELKQAELPVVYRGSEENTWKYITADGWMKNLANDDARTAMHEFVYYTANINNTAYWVQNWFKPGANRISFRIRYGNATSNYQIALKESADGETWEDVVVYKPDMGTDPDNPEMPIIPTVDNPDPTPVIPTSSSTLGLRSYSLKSTSQYVKFAYELRTNTSFYIDDVVIENAAADTQAPTLVSEQPKSYANYSENTKSQIVLQFSEPVKVSEELIKRTTGIKINGVTYYENNILCTRDGELALTNLEAVTDNPDDPKTPLLEDEGEYTIEIPANALVDLANNPFAGKTLKFTATITGISTVDKEQLDLYITDGAIYINEEVKKVELYNSLGMLSKVEHNTQQINISGLKGMYIVRCTMVNGKTKVAKIIF